MDKYLFLKLLNKLVSDNHKDTFEIKHFLIEEDKCLITLYGINKSIINIPNCPMELNSDTTLIFNLYELSNRLKNLAYVNGYVLSSNVGEKAKCVIIKDKKVLKVVYGDTEYNAIIHGCLWLLTHN